jgi:hypothetical protein
MTEGNVIPLFTPAEQELNAAWRRFRDRREEIERDFAPEDRTTAFTEALRELNEAITKARNDGHNIRMEIR